MSSVALVSIRPPFAAAILDGSKKVEFRRTRMSDELSLVVIYATSPIQRILGTFEVDGAVVLEPRIAWTLYGHMGAIDRTSFDSYYEGAETGYVIRIRNPRPLENGPMALSSLAPNLRPPQSFRYLPKAMLNRLGLAELEDLDDKDPRAERFRLGP